MAIFFTCSSCGVSTKVEDPMRPGDCKCGKSLVGSVVSAAPPQERKVSFAQPTREEMIARRDLQRAAAAFEARQSPQSGLTSTTPPPSLRPTPPTTQTKPPPAPTRTPPASREVSTPPASREVSTPPTGARMEKPRTVTPTTGTRVPGSLRSESTSTHHEILIPERTGVSHGSNCPQCDQRVTKSCVVCVNCGYNFEDGKVLTATSQNLLTATSENVLFATVRDIDTNVLQTRIIIQPTVRKIGINVFLVAAVIGIIAGIGAVIYSSMQTPFGVSSGNPLGTLTKIQANLESAGLKKGPGNKDIVYRNPVLERKSKRKIRETVRLVFDDGKLVGIEAKFQATEVADGSRVLRFLRKYWKELGGMPDGTEVDTSDISAIWDKGADSKPLEERKQSVRIALKGSTFKAKSQN